MRKCAISAHAKPTVDMAAATLKKASILDEQKGCGSFLQFVMIKCRTRKCEYLQLRGYEELAKLKCRLQPQARAPPPSLLPRMRPSANATKRDELAGSIESAASSAIETVEE
ncbi:unnamed protein product [Sphagnum jensenii]|uniref:Uncharacterized protein n=1 Tax=Sphagnum jensenii TaxID=128206 RepID=A0ABP1C1I2_9BRYO